MYSDSLPANPPADKFIDDSASGEATQEQPARQSTIASNRPSLYKTVSSSPPSTPQIPSQKVDDRSGPISQENHGERAETEGSQNERADVISKETLQHSPPSAGDNHSESEPVSPENRGGSARMNEGPNETSHVGPAATLQDPPSHVDYDFSESGTDPQETLSSGNVSRVNVSDEGPGELSVRKLVFAVAEIGVGPDFNRGSDGIDEGNDWSETRQDDLEAPGMLLFSTLPTCTLHL